MSIAPVSTRSLATPPEPTFKRALPRISTRVAVVAMGIFTLATLPKAEAGFALLALCMSACTAATGGFGAMACAAACAATAPLPTP